eukprot:1727075-Rhodomonas_salina.1
MRAGLHAGEAGPTDHWQAQGSLRGSVGRGSRRGEVGRILTQKGREEGVMGMWSRRGGGGS